MIEQEAGMLLGWLERLCTEIGCDFCSLGWVDGEGKVLRWRVAVGNENERYRSITERAGRGLSATVMKIGRAMPMNINELICSRSLQEYPLMLAENLRSAYAVPLFKGREVDGVLLTGDRKKRVYRSEDRRMIALVADRIVEWMSGERPAASL